MSDITTSDAAGQTPLEVSLMKLKRAATGHRTLTLGRDEAFALFVFVDSLRVTRGKP